MAIWQADYFLIPKGKGKGVEKNLRRDFAWWAEDSFPKEYETVFKSLFSLSQEKVYGGDEYGDIDGTYVSVGSEYGRVSECYVRFDLRALERKDLHTFLIFCSANKIELLVIRTVR